MTRNFAGDRVYRVGYLCGGVAQYLNKYIASRTAFVRRDNKRSSAGSSGANRRGERMVNWRRKFFRSVENIRLALVAIWVSRLRALLTMLIIAIGLLALMGMLTVINAVSYTIESELADERGALFEIISWAPQIQISGKRRNLGEDYSYITRWQADRFCQDYALYGTAGYMTWITYTKLKHRDKESRPSLLVEGINETYLQANNKNLDYGRAFTATEHRAGTDVVILGSSLAEQLVGSGTQALGKRVLIGSAPFTVVGILASQSSSFGGARNEDVYIPLRTGLTRFAVSEADCKITVSPYTGSSLNEAKANAEMIMRRARKLRPIQRNTFNIITNDEITKMILESLSSVGISAILIGLITLIGSAIGLMNIMLASVTERTREIGTRKAIGAYGNTIRGQFLLEAIFITVFGGLFGIFLGILAGKAASLAMGVKFTIPWLWALSSLVLCIVVGILAGYLPASRAARLDPIDALRYE